MHKKYVFHVCVNIIFLSYESKYLIIKELFNIGYERFYKFIFNPNKITFLFIQFRYDFRV